MNTNSESNEVLWICGFPGSGKTWFGDYLASRGWHHIDGDCGGLSPDKEVKEIWDKYMAGFQTFTTKGEKVPEEIWMPQYKLYVQSVKDALA